MQYCHFKSKTLLAQHFGTVLCENTQQLSQLVTHMLAAYSLPCIENTGCEKIDRTV